MPSSSPRTRAGSSSPSGVRLLGEARCGRRRLLPPTLGRNVRSRTPMPGSGVNREIAIPPRVWTYDALRCCGVLVPVDDVGGLDRTRIGPLWLPHYHPQGGWGWISPRGPERGDLARWLFGIAAIHRTYLTSVPDRAVEGDRLFDAFVQFDESCRAWSRVGHDARNPRLARAARQTVARASSEARGRLAAALKNGLERRVVTTCTETRRYGWPSRPGILMCRGSASASNARLCFGRRELCAVRAVALDRSGSGSTP